jgi:hypothetical protein
MSTSVDTIHRITTDDEKIYQTILWLTFDFDCIPGGTYNNLVMMEMLGLLTGGKNKATFVINTSEDDDGEYDIRTVIREFLYYRNKVNMVAFSRRYPGDFLVRALSTVCFKKVEFTLKEFKEFGKSYKQLRVCSFEYITRNFLDYAKNELPPTPSSDFELLRIEIESTAFVLPIDEEVQRLRDESDNLEFPTDAQQLFAE